MTYQIDIARIEIVQPDGNLAVGIEAVDPSTAEVRLNVKTNVDDWHAMSQAVSQALLLMQLKVPK